MEKRIVILIVILCLLSFILGGGLGFFYKDQISVSQTSNTEVIKNLSSEMVTSIMVYGKVSGINGRTMTLSYNDKTMVLEVGNDAQIYSLVSQTVSNSAINEQLKSFDDVKVGDSVNVALTMPSEGVFNVTSIVILPASNTAE